MQFGHSSMDALTFGTHRPGLTALRLRLGAAFLALSLGCGAFPDEAGLGDMQASQSQAIIDGVQSRAADYPATGVIIYRSQRHGMTLGAMLCSATLIASDVVIAAGHCDAGLLGDSDYPVSFYFTLSLDVSESGVLAGILPQDAVRISRFVPHPEFGLDNLGTGLRAANDIALVFLERSIKNIIPAALIRADQRGALVAGAEVLIVGYGRRHPLTLGLGDMGIKYQGTSQIREVGAYEMHIGRAHPGSYKCHGDSGGPTYMHLSDDAEALSLVGVTSRIYTHGDCGMGGTDTRIDPYLPWIKRSMQEACRSGLRPSCRGRYDVRLGYLGTSDG